MIFFGTWPAVRTEQDRNPNNQALMLHIIVLNRGDVNELWKKDFEDCENLNIVQTEI